MRKHRLYGVVLATLLGAGVLTQLPNSPHDHSFKYRFTSSHELTGSHDFTHSHDRSARSTRLDVSTRFFDPSDVRTDVARSTKNENLHDRRRRHRHPVEPTSFAYPEGSLLSLVTPWTLGEAQSPPAPHAPAHSSGSQPSQPAPAPASAPTPSPTPAPVQSTAPEDGVWAELRSCESDDNYADDTGNGYYGAYQFSLGTWESLGFSGLPSQASPSQQDSAAAELQARSGWGQWPACASQLGLL